MKIRNFLFALVLGSTVMSCGGSSSMDAASYNNELMEMINSNENHISDMNTAMVAKDYVKAEKVRTEWESSLTKQEEKVKKLGSFKGDDVMEKGVLNGLQAYKKIVTTDYKELITIRKDGLTDPASAVKEEKALSNINVAFETAANEVNKASNAFQQKYAK